jgi:hypothetical protein
MNDPDIVLIVDRDSRNLTEDPTLRQWLRPERVDDLARAIIFLSSGWDVIKRGNQSRGRRCGNQQSFHGRSSGYGRKK